MALDPRIISQAGSQGLQAGFQNLLTAQQAQRQNRLARAQEQQLQQAQQRQNRLAQLAQQSFDPGQAAIPGLPQQPAMGPVRPGEALPDYAPQQAQPALPPQFDLQGFQSRLLGEGMIPEAGQVGQFIGGGSDLPASPREFEYLKAQFPDREWNYSDYLNMKRQGISVKDVGGVPTIVNAVTGEQRPLSTLDIEAQAEAETEKGKGLGRTASKQIEQASEQIPKISENIRNLDEVIRLIDKEGAVTGPVARMFPSFRKSSVQLDNMRRRLGLDVIGSVTFGALSEAELNMALDTALPTGLRGDALSSWARQKRDAQAKLRDYLQDQVSFLSMPGNTMTDWYEQNQNRQQSRQQGQTIGRFQVQVEE